MQKIWREYGLSAVLAVGVFVGCVAAASSAHAVIVTPDLEEDGWSENTFPTKGDNSFLSDTDGSLEVISDHSISVLYHPVRIDLKNTPFLTWEWRVDEAMPPADLVHAGGDDRPLALMVGFPAPDRSGFLDSVGASMTRMIAGREVPPRVLSYVYGGQGKLGDWQRSPHMNRMMMRLLRPGVHHPGEWFAESVDLRRDFQEAFHINPIDPIEIAISADSDNTGTVSVGWIRNLRFLPENKDEAGAVRILNSLRAGAERQKAKP